MLPHERTMSAPKEDRYRLLKATGLNTSPIVVLAGSDPAATSAALEALAAGPPDTLIDAADGVRHRLWIRPAPDRGLPGDLDPRPGQADASVPGAPADRRDHPVPRHMRCSTSWPPRR